MSRVEKIVIDIFLLFLLASVGSLIVDKYRVNTRTYHTEQELSEGVAAAKNYGFHYFTDKRGEMGVGSLSVIPGQDQSKIISWDLRLKDSKYGSITQSAFVDKRSIVDRDCYEVTTKISTFDSNDPCTPTSMRFGGYPVVRRFADSRYFLTTGTVGIEIYAHSDEEASIIIEGLKPITDTLAKDALATTYIHAPL